MGVRKIKFLGGEPLLRPDLPEIVADLRRIAPSTDLSLITSGAIGPMPLEAAFASGLDRANVTIHGWTSEAFAKRGGTATRYAKRTRTLDLLLGIGRQFKVNYVYSGPVDEPDLAGLLNFAAGRPIVVNVLDDLGDPTASSVKVMAALRRLRGPWAGTVYDIDPDSLSTTHLYWDDGLTVEVKSSRLGDVAPWRACRWCWKRAGCREGIFAVRLMAGGDLRLCMDRPDLRINLADVVSKGGMEAGAQAWAAFIGDAIQGPRRIERNARPARPVLPVSRPPLRDCQIGECWTSPILDAGRSLP
jgi:molybdenum cofactor biosynthesis enzyme MoaA